MSPRRSRRARRRSSRRRLVWVLAVAVLLALVIGGLTQVSSQSSGYHANSGRTLAAQGGVVADQSNVTASSVRSLMSGLQGQTRQGLETALDSAVRQTASQEGKAWLVASQNPLGTLSDEFAAAFADRAQAMAALRGALDGFLGMQPLPVAGAGGGEPDAQTTLLSSTQATTRIAAAGSLLAQSDQLYRSVRRQLAAAGGHGRLPRSVWVINPGSWQADNVASEVDLVSTSSTLAATHDVVIRTTRLSPPALPTAAGNQANVSVLSPVPAVAVTTVLANQGSVAEAHVEVHLSMADQTSGTTETRAATTALALGGSVTLPTVSFPVRPGTLYVLTVQVVLPPGQTLTNGTELQQALQVAPAS